MVGPVPFYFIYFNLSISSLLIEKYNYHPTLYRVRSLALLPFYTYLNREHIKWLKLDNHRQAKKQKWLQEEHMRTMNHFLLMHMKFKQAIAEKVK